MKVFGILTLLLVIFVNFPVMQDPCAWPGNRCADHLPTDIISPIPNFYVPTKCGGIAGLCYPGHFSWGMLSFDLILWGVLNLIFLTLIKIKNKLWQK